MEEPKSKKGLSKRISKINYSRFNYRSKKFKNSFFIANLKFIKNIDRVFLV
jgi:hypothetical protein